MPNLTLIVVFIKTLHLRWRTRIGSTDPEKNSLTLKNSKIETSPKFECLNSQNKELPDASRYAGVRLTLSLVSLEYRPDSSRIVPFFSWTIPAP